MMIGLAGAFLVAALASASPHAQSGFDAARDLYVAADYEAALAAFDRLAASDAAAGSLAEIERYRALCLIALGRAADADRVIEQLIQKHPEYQPDEQEAPRVRAAFANARARVLPQVARNFYTEAKTAYDQRDHQTAVPAFERTLSVLDSIESEDPALEDLKTLASGFLDLSRAALAPPAPAAAPARTATAAEERVAGARSEPVTNGGPGTAGGPTGAAETRAADPTSGGTDGAASNSDAEVTLPPVVLQQALPEWSPPLFAPQFQSEFRGAVEVVIDDTGQVVSAKIVEPIHPAYDQRLLEATSRWRYEPARRGNLPVAATKRVDVVLRPRR